MKKEKRKDVSHPEAVRQLLKNPEMTLADFIDLNIELKKRDNEDVEKLIATCQ